LVTNVLFLTVPLHQLRVRFPALSLVIGVFVPPLLLAIAHHLAITRHPSPASGGENSRGAGADNPADCKLVVGDGAEKAEMSFGSKDNGGSRSCGLLRVRTEIPEEN
jgi:hypothetical protein